MTSYAVIGAGFAGLAAADALEGDVVVFEARDRVGGRVHSRTLENGAVVELGAEFVLPGHEVLRATVARLGLELYEKGTLYGDREPRPPVPRDQLLAGIARLADARGDSITSALDALGLAPAVRDALLARVEISTAYRGDDQPASVLAASGAAFGAFPSDGVGGGNQQVALALAARLHVELNAPVRRIEWSARGVRVHGRDYDGCVVAVPAHAEIEFDPPLPDWKRAAIAAVTYGQAAKLFLPLAEPAPPSATLSVPGRFWAYTQRRNQVLAAFAGSRTDGLTPEAVRALRPELAYADAEPVGSTWPEGAYSARSCASPLDDEALAAPVGPLAFAGEHTAGPWHALMEGALRSGLRAARDLDRTGAREDHPMTT